MDIEKNIKKLIKNGKNVERIIACLVNTIQFIDLFYQIQPNALTFQKVTRAYESYRKENSPFLAISFEADNVIENLLSKTLKNNDNINELISECAFINGTNMQALKMLAVSNVNANGRSDPLGKFKYNKFYYIIIKIFITIKIFIINKTNRSYVNCKIIWCFKR